MPKELTKEEITHIEVLSKVLTIHGYRNSAIEDIHAGRWPTDKEGHDVTEDDAIVISKHGGKAIPWKQCSRISDKEMKELNKEIHNQIFTLLYMMKTTGIPAFYTLYGSNWDKPTLLQEWLDTQMS